jgi:hypothetical protein
MDTVNFTSSIDLLTSLKLHYVLIPSSILTALNEGEEKGKFNQRVIIRLNDQIEWQGGIVALREGDGYIAVSQARMKQLKIERFDEVTVVLTKDNSEFGHEFPPELQEVFLQDIEAEQRFRGMAPGKQRTIIYYILQVKSSEKRAERSWLFMTNLKLLPIGKETMRGIFGKE